MLYWKGCGQWSITIETIKTELSRKFIKPAWILYLTKVSHFLAGALLSNWLAEAPLHSLERSVLHCSRKLLEFRETIALCFFEDLTNLNKLNFLRWYEPQYSMLLQNIFLGTKVNLHDASKYSFSYRNYIIPVEYMLHQADWSCKLRAVPQMLLLSRSASHWSDTIQCAPSWLLSFKKYF